MAVQTAAGSRLFIGTTATASLTDTYLEVGQITNLGQFGRSYEEIKYNALGNRNVIKFKGQRDDGDIQLDLGRSASDVGQAALIAALDVDLDYNFKVTLNDPVTPSVIAALAATIATPSVFTMATAAPPNGTPAQLSTTGALPTGFSPFLQYYVVASSSDTFELAATLGGSAIAGTGTQSGQITGTLQLGSPTTFYFKAKTMSYQTTVGPANQVVAARTMLGIASGTIIEQAPT
jgi:hypothetical protein